jgi:hypothetical protein
VVEQLPHECKAWIHIPVHWYVAARQEQQGYAKGTKMGDPLGPPAFEGGKRWGAGKHKQ